MASGGEWDAEKMLDQYLYDYMVKKNMRRTAEIFRREAQVSINPLPVDAPNGFLYEWWSIFYDRLRQIEAAEKLEMGQENVHPLVPESDMIQATETLETEVQTDTDFEKMLGHSDDSLLSAIFYDVKRLGIPAGDTAPNPLLDGANNMDLQKSAATTSSNMQQQHSEQSQQRIENRSIVFGVPKGRPPRPGQCDAGSFFNFNN